MKKTYILIILISSIFAISCTNQNTQEEVKTPEKLGNADAKIQVIYFHSTNRCATCNAVESNAKKLLNENFKTQIENGNINFSSLNIDEEKNKTITEKYLISTSTLLIINNNTKEEIVVDFTTDAFKYARTEPIKYTELLKEEINKQLEIN